MLFSTIKQRLLAASRAVSTQAITAGHYTFTTLAAALTSALSATVTADDVRSWCVPMGPDRDGARQRTAELTGFATSANNGTFSAYVWQGKWCGNQGGKPTDFELVYLGKADFTLGQKTGASTTSTIKSTELIADTVAWTPATTATSPKGCGTATETAWGGVAASAYSPADDTIGRLFLSECGNADFLLFEMVKGTAADANVVAGTGT